MAKKLLAIIVAVAMTCGMFVGCENTNTGENNTSPKLDSTVDNNNQKFIQVAVKIVNGTTVDFAELYTSGVTINNWGDNLLDNGVTFAPGDAVNVTFNIDENNLKWDFKAIDYYGNSLEFNGLDLSNCDVNGINITLTYNNQTQIGEIIAN